MQRCSKSLCVHFLCRLTSRNVTHLVRDCRLIFLLLCSASSAFNGTRRVPEECKVSRRASIMEYAVLPVSSVSLCHGSGPYLLLHDLVKLLKRIFVSVSCIFVSVSVCLCVCVSVCLCVCVSCILSYNIIIYFQFIGISCYDLKEQLQDSLFCKGFQLLYALLLQTWFSTAVY